MIRFLTTLATMLLLSAVYSLYTALVVPLTVARVDLDALASSGNLEGYQPPVLTDTAVEYFPDLPWLQAGDIKTFQSRQTFFYTRDVQRDEVSGNQVRMSPIAVLFKDPRRPDEKPFRLIAEKGLIQFENRFFDSALHVAGASPGRIVWATLEGAVHIDGPDGLQLDGRQFVFSEQSGQLYSDHRVAFHYGPTAHDGTEVTGSADQINISLKKAEASILGEDMPRIGGVSLLTLRRNINLTAHFQQEGEQHQLHLTCDGPFEYDVDAKVVHFNQRVEVTHLAPDGKGVSRNRLTSEQLSLQFVSTAPVPVDPQPGESLDQGKFLDDLKLSEIRALGTTEGLGGRRSQVKLTSEEHDLAATMQELHYHLIERTAHFFDPQGVIARRGAGTFHCPDVLLIHREDRQLERLECRGAGQLLVGHEKLGEGRAEVKWEGQVIAAPDPQGTRHIVEVQENAQLLFPGLEHADGGRQLEMGIAANLIKLWVDLDQAQKLESRGPLLQETLPLEQAEAIGEVAMVSSDLVIEKCDRALIVLETPDSIRAQSGKTESLVSATDDDSHAAPLSRNRDSNRSPVRVSTDNLQVSLVHDRQMGRIDLHRVVGEGKVRIRHQPSEQTAASRVDQDNPVVLLTGTRLIAENQGPSAMAVTLLGIVDKFGEVTHPAELQFGDVRIAGANLTYLQAQNQVAILGPGAFQLPVSRNLDGDPLDHPAFLEVVWQERMTFDGLDAKFLQAVSCSLKGHQENISRVNCDDLTVRLNQKVAFQQNAPDTDDLDIEWIHARNGVELEAYQFEQAKLKTIHLAKVSEFRIQQQTGDFVGVGRGEIQSWTLGDQIRLAPTDTVESNQPIRNQDEPHWRYSRLEFSGKLTGNFLEKTAQFDRQRIRILSAPVNQAKAKFSEDDVSSVSNAVRLDCRSLKIFQRDYQDRPYWELFAQEVNELEGQVFRAVADELSFDERLGRFILRGIGKDATLYFQERPGASFSPSSHRLIEFIPRKRSITVDGSSGLSG